MPRAARFRPISGSRPDLIEIASIYFILGGIVSALLTLTVLPRIFMPELRDSMTTVELVISVVLMLLLAGGMILTGILLSRQSRRGAYFALAFVVLSLLTSFDLYSVAFTALSVTILALIWRDLH